MSFNPSLLFSAVEPTGPELVNPCYAGTHDCDTTAQCIPQEGQAFRCQCATGYRGDGRNCYGTGTQVHIRCPRCLPGYTVVTVYVHFKVLHCALFSLLVPPSPQTHAS